MRITELIEQGRQGDEKALTALYDLYIHRVTEACSAIVADMIVALSDVLKSYTPFHAVFFLGGAMLRHSNVSFLRIFKSSA